MPVMFPLLACSKGIQCPGNVILEIWPNSVIQGEFAQYADGGCLVFHPGVVETRGGAVLLEVGLPFLQPIVPRITYAAKRLGEQFYVHHARINEYLEGNLNDH